MFFILIPLLLAAICYGLHLWGTTYWKRRGVFQVEPSFIFGNVKDIVLMKRTMQSYVWEVYQKHKKHKLIGIYSFYRPMLIATDPEIIKQITVRESSSFAGAPIEIDTHTDPVTASHPKATDDMESWKEGRKLQQLLFSPKKIQFMPALTAKIGHDMTNFLMERKNKPIMSSEITERFIMDSVWNYIFGAESMAFTNPNSSFRKHVGRNILGPNSTFAANAMFLFPTLAKLLSYRLTSDESEEFMMAFTKTKMGYQEENVSGKLSPLFFEIIAKENQKRMKDGHKGLTVEEVMCHGTSIYLDSYFFTANGFQYFLSDLAKRPDVQDKLRKEILSVGKNIDDFDYKKIESIEYLHFALMESLRLHSPTPVSARVCSKPTEVDGIKIEKGMKILVPYFALHLDDRYFDDPDKYEPDRHVSIDTYKKDNLLPFGDGPRMCLGFRFVQLVLKVGVLYILMHFKILPVNSKDEDSKYSMLPYSSPDENEELIFQPIND